MLIEGSDFVVHQEKTKNKEDYKEILRVDLPDSAQVIPYKNDK